MFINRVPNSLLLDQLSADTYDPVLIANVAKVGNGDRLADFLLKEPKLGVTGTIADSYVSEDVPGSVPYLTTKQVKGLFAYAQDCKYITAEADELWSKCRVTHGAILINKSGDVGAAALLSAPHLRHVNTVSDLINISVKSGPDGFDSAYFVVYLNSPYAQDQLRRLSGGAIFSHVSIFAVPQVRVFRPHIHAQKYIGDKVRQAERLREVSAKMKANVSSLMLSCFAGLPKPNRTCYSRVSVVNTKVNRLEAEYYGNVALWAETEILGSRFETKLLGDLATRIKDGPGGWGVSTNDYVESGVPVIRGVNIVDGDCDIRDCVFIDVEKHHELRGHRAEKGSVVLSVRGTIGRSAVFDLPGIEEASLNAAVVTIDCTDEIEPHYLAEFFNSEIGQIQTERIANGAVQQNMNLTETQSNRIVVPPMEFQQDIARRRRLRIQAARLAGQLVEAAKLLVEALIERKVTEDELIHAHTLLEQGDDSADRTILSRLFDGGWDATETRPLFPDLDVYYETLRMANCEQSEAAAI